MCLVMRRLMAWFFCVLLAAGVLLSAWFLAREIRHDCTGENCPVCACLRAAARQLRGSGRPAAAAVAAATVFGVIRVLGGAVRRGHWFTPVDCKVRLDN